MDILNGKIRVYNYEMSPAGFPSNHSQQGVFIRGRDEEEEFVVERVALDDIETENSKSDLFKVGRLRFHPDEENEVYKKLGIEDLDNIMSDKQMFEFLLTDSIENVKKISSLKSSTLLNRMKHKLFVLERTNKTPPHNIVAAVLERSNELKNGGKRNTNSEISRILNNDQKNKEDVALKKTLDELTSKIQKLEEDNKSKDQIIEKSQSAIEALLKRVESLVPAQENNTQQEDKKPSGRPPKK